jgi:ATP-binding cassette, subfamily B (MDR/TAP), member 1
MATSQVLGFLIADTFVSIGCLVVALYHSYQLTLVLMATVPVSVLALHFISCGIDPAIVSQKRELAQASKIIIAAVTAIDLVKIYDAMDNEVWQYLKAANGSMQYFIRQASRNSMQMGFLKLWVINLFVVGFWFAGYLVSRNIATPGSALTAFYSILTAFQAIEGVGPQWLVLAKGMSAGHQLHNILAARRESGNTRKMEVPHRPQSCAKEIELQDVSFAYPSSE